nr:Ig-like domain-containing protein [Clostridium saccharoperbutylacetonicum]
MFIMLLVVIGVGVIQNGTVANAATIGEPLTSPEAGWTAVDDTDSKIVSPKGTINNYTERSHYNRSLRIVAGMNGKIVFQFYGTKFRIISEISSLRSSKINVKIDGINVDNITMQGNTSVNQALVYEKLGLPLTIHYVILTNVDGGIANTNMDLDAIHLDDNGYLVPYVESISLNKTSPILTVGDSRQLTAITTPLGLDLTWTSSNSNIARVDSTGKVTGVAEGAVIIKATTENGLTEICTVPVMPRGTDPNLEPRELEYIVNTARAKGDNTNNPGGEVTIIFHGSSDTTLSLVKTADVKDVWIGDNFTYTLVITNTGSKTAKAVVVNDPAPNHIDFNVSGVTTTQGTVDSSSTSKNIIVNVGDILPGGTVTIKIPSTVIA